MAFMSPLVLEAAPKQDFWIVRAPLTWLDPKYNLLQVPVGFMTDLASIPRALRNLPAFDPNGQSRRPAVVHDWLYTTHSRGKDIADSFLRDALIAEGASELDADAFYEAVHLYGDGPYDTGGAPAIAASFVDKETYLAWVATQ